MKEFNIGDRVRVKDYTDISEINKAKTIKDKPYLWNAGKAKVAGKEGVIVDKLYSEAHSRFLYRVQFDGYEIASHASFDGDSFELIEVDPITYCHEFEYLDNVVLAKFYEVKGDKKTELGRGHGHIMHDGAYGIAQASSYALLKIMRKMEENGNGI